jgi:hypothetical protein
MRRAYGGQARQQFKQIYLSLASATCPRRIWFVFTRPVGGWQQV